MQKPIIGSFLQTCRFGFDATETFLWEELHRLSRRAMFHQQFLFHDKIVILQKSKNNFNKPCKIGKSEPPSMLSMFTSPIPMAIPSTEPLAKTKMAITLFLNRPPAESSTPKQKPTTSL